MIKKGDTVKLKPEWMDAGDEDVVFTATEDMEKGRVLVEADKCQHMAITPTFLIHDYMIEA